MGPLQCSLASRFFGFKSLCTNPRECKYAIPNAILEMMSTSSWSLKGLTFAPERRVSISSRRLPSIYSNKIVHCPLNTDNPINCAMQGWRLTLIKVVISSCIALVIVLFFNTFSANVHPNQVVLRTVAKAPEPIGPPLVSSFGWISKFSGIPKFADVACIASLVLHASPWRCL